jgi:hypothetical protein
MNIENQDLVDLFNFFATTEVAVERFHKSKEAIFQITGNIEINKAIKHYYPKSNQKFDELTEYAQSKVMRLVKSKQKKNAIFLANLISGLENLKRYNTHFYSKDDQIVGNIVSLINEVLDLKIEAKVDENKEEVKNESIQ